MLKPDALWKSILEDFFENFLYFFYPIESQEIDWKIPPEFLDKELSKLLPKSKTKGRYADKLVKLRLKNGLERWILVHVEVQGYPDPHFAHRMYQMRVRIRERFGIEVVALAILTDDDENYFPNQYSEKTWDSELIYRWRTFKLMHHPPESFQNPENVISVILSVAYHRLKKGKLEDENLLEFKLDLLEKLRDFQLPEEKIWQLLTFIEYYVSFKNQEFQRIFDQKLDEFLKIEPNMSTYELKVYTQMKPLIKKAKLEGIEEGELKGELKGKKEGIILFLKRGFSVEETAKDFGVSVDFVLEIKNELALQNIEK